MKSYIFEIDKCIADTMRFNEVLSHEVLRTYLQLFAKSIVSSESAFEIFGPPKRLLPMRRYMKSYLARLVSSTISLSIAYIMLSLGPSSKSHATYLVDFIGYIAQHNL